ncbi:hypothetical protein DFH09DRAFT_1179928 [Mycena vulgaris]|nr:hypothetical protein DFH09DRAFT_1179928 [Mycena vulgaris]
MRRRRRSSLVTMRPPQPPLRLRDEYSRRHAQRRKGRSCPQLQTDTHDPLHDQRSQKRARVPRLHLHIYSRSSHPVRDCRQGSAMRCTRRQGGSCEERGAYAYPTSASHLAPCSVHRSHPAVVRRSRGCSAAPPFPPNRRRHTLPCACSAAPTNVKGGPFPTPARTWSGRPGACAALACSALSRFGRLQRGEGHGGQDG